MHASMDFWTNLAVSIASTGLLGRILFMLLGKLNGGARLATAHVITLVSCWMLFVVWCSSGGTIYWWAGHVVFAPWALWLIYDILHFTGQGDVLDEEVQRTRE